MDPNLDPDGLKDNNTVNGTKTIRILSPSKAIDDGKDNLGQSVASGVYYYTLQAGEFRATRKMVIIK